MRNDSDASRIGSEDFGFRRWNSDLTLEGFQGGPKQFHAESRRLGFLVPGFESQRAKSWPRQARV